MFERFGSRLWSTASLLTVAAAIAAPAAAQQGQMVDFHIPSQPMGAALNSLSQQSGVRLVYPYDQVSGLRSHAVSGRMSTLEALQKLINQQPLKIVLVKDGVIALRGADAAGSQAALTPASATTAASSDGAAAGPAPEAPPHIEEIVVTAEKREQPISKVPISISAYSRAGMDVQGVRSVDDITRLTPGLSNISTSSYGGKTISIRGINSNTGASTTGVYIDDVPVQTRNYLGVVNNTYPLVFDLDRIEVLRGPQGTLFGSGSEGGTIRFITPTPSLTRAHFYGRGDVSYTNGAGDPNGEMGLSASMPLVEDRVAVSLSGWGSHTGGYIDRVSHDTGATVAKNTNSEDDMAFRGSMLIAVNNALTITPSLYYQRTSKADLDLYWPEAGTYKSWYGIAQPDKDRFLLPALSIQYDFPAVTVKSITSYYDRKDDRTEDYAPLSIGTLTGGAQAFVPGVNFHEKSDTITRQNNWSQEVRIASRDPDAAFTWTVGAFYSQSVQTYDQTEVDNIGDLIPVLSPHDDTESFYKRDQLPGHVSFIEHMVFRTTETAAFGEASYTFAKKLKATAGVRISRGHFSYTDFQDGPFVGRYSLSYAGEAGETPVTPRFNLSYALTEGQVYLSAAKGYRIGGANPQVPSTCAADLATIGLTSVPSTYKSDSVWSYELGLKQRLFDHKLAVEGSLYTVDWSGIQANVPLNCGFGYNTNLGSATSKGFDLQVQATPIRDLQLTAAVGYNDSSYSGTVLGATPEGEKTPTVLARKGDDLGTPKVQASVSVRYAWPVRSDMKAYVFAADQYSGPYHRTGSYGVNGYNSYTREGRATNTANLRVGVEYRRWDWSAYVDNLFNSHVDTYYYRAQAGGPDGARAMTQRPLTAGVTLTRSY
ncbi:MAG: TonB-dependent receptor [Caulobacteraceae bacterium]|nr:TonB-dependent receptor [Caulobacteraceae bacterium]